MAERYRRIAWLSAGTLVCFAVLVALGTWQMERRAEKHAQLAVLAERRALEPLTALPDAVGQEMEHRRVRLEGRFLPGKEVRLYGRSRNGVPGVEIVTPLALADGRAVLVNRGWVAANAPAAGMSEDVALEGEISLGERPGFYTPANQPGKGQWYYADIAAIAEHGGVAALPFLVVARTPTGTAVPREAALPPDNHLQYALTWYSLAGILVIIYVLLVRSP
jgi:surfeit locus 1 family protein